MYVPFHVQTEIDVPSETLSLPNGLNKAHKLAVYKRNVPIEIICFRICSEDIFSVDYIYNRGAWGSVVIKALRY